MKNQAADALSRIDTDGVDSSLMDDSIPCLLTEIFRETEEAKEFEFLPETHWAREERLISPSKVFESPITE